MRTKTFAGGTAMLLPLLCACATVDPRPDFAAAARLATEATGATEVYRPEFDDGLRARIDARLADGLELHEAVEVALLNNPRLQRAFLGLGVSRSNLVQAGLLPNPSLGFALRFPSGGGATEIESELTEDIATLFGRGARQRAAQAALDADILDVARQATELAIRAQLAYFEVIAARERGAIAAENVEVARGLVLVAEGRDEAGAGTRLEVNVAHSELDQSTLEEREAELAVRGALLNLSGVLGLEPPLPPTALVSPLPEPRTWEVDEGALLEISSRARLDLEAARRRVTAARGRCEQERKSRWPELELGLAHEGADGTTALGPAIGVELPLFDQNQARIAKARYLLAVAERELTALEQDVRRQVRSAYQRAHLEWEMTTFFRDELLPHSRQNMELAREAYQEGKVSFLSALEAQQRFLATRQEFVERRLQSALAGPALERALGVSLDQALIPTTNEDDERDEEEHHEH